MIKRSSIHRVLLGTALSAVGVVCVSQPGAQAAPAPAASLAATQQPGFTKPSDETALAFIGPGIVSKVLVKAGDTIKAGDLVATQDDREEKAKLAVAKLDADSDKEIKAAQADLEAKKVEYQRKKDLYADRIKEGLSNSELDEARVAVDIASIVVEFRREDKEKKGLELALQQVKLEQKQLVSPINGVVAKVEIHAGDGSDLTKPAIQVVQNDPLWVEVDLPSARAKQLKLKQTLQVRYNDDDTLLPADIIFLTPYANAGSNTRHVRLQMPNPTHREAGLPVVVQLPDNLASR